MDNGDFEKRKKALLDKFERTLRMQMPLELRQRIEAIPNTDNEIYLQDVEGIVDDYIDIAMNVIKEYLHSHKRLNDSKPRERYQRSFEKRLHLVSYVIGKQLPIIFEDDIPTGRSYPTPLLARFNWKKLCNKWNKEHPYDQMTPHVLKAEYYRAIREEALQNEYLKRRYTHINLTKESFIEAIKKAKEANNERSHNQEVQE